MDKEFNIGKREETIGLNNSLWIKKFQNGVKLRRRGQGELTFSVDEIWQVLMYLRNFGKRMAFPILLSASDMIPLWQKYPETQEFIQKMLDDEVHDEEREKIREDYERKNKIIKALEEK